MKADVVWKDIRLERTHTPEETQELAGWFAEQLVPGDSVALVGELGAGKTTFVRGIVHSLGYEGRVRSPSFTLVHRYPTTPPLVHADLYRLSDVDELIALNLEGDLEQGVLLVEWADKLDGEWGNPGWRVELDIPDLTNEGLREIRLMKREEVEG